MCIASPTASANAHDNAAAAAEPRYSRGFLRLCRYPISVVRSELTREYTFSNYIVYSVYRATPFLFEMRMLLDWTCTPTTLSLDDWFKMEDIYGQLFVNRGKIIGQREDTRKPGERQPFARKLLKGALLVGLLIIVIWSPLLIMSIANDNAVPNTPIKVTASLTVGSFQPVFVMDVLPAEPVTQYEYQQLLDLDSTGFVKQFQPPDVQRAVLSSQSKALWDISPSSRQALVDGLEANRTMTLTFGISFERRVRSGAATASQDLEKQPLPYNSTERYSLLEALDDEGGSMRLEALFPVFFHLTSLDKPEPISQLPYTLRGYTANCSLHRHAENGSEWWSLEQSSPHVVSLLRVCVLLPGPGLLFRMASMASLLQSGSSLQNKAKARCPNSDAPPPDRRRWNPATPPTPTVTSRRSPSKSSPSATVRQVTPLRFSTATASSACTCPSSSWWGDSSGSWSTRRPTASSTRTCRRSMPWSTFAMPSTRREKARILALKKRCSGC